MRRLAFAGALVVVAATALVAQDGATTRVPDFSGRWQVRMAVRPLSGGPTTALFGGRLTPPQQVNPPPFTSTGARQATGSVSFQSIIGADGRIADIEPIVASVWSGFLPDLVKTMTESQRRQQFRAARLNNRPVASLLNSISQTHEKPETVAATNVPLNHEIRIEQNATSLTSRRDTPLGVEIAVYPLDGAAIKTRFVMAAPTAAEWEHTSRWDDDRLVTTTVAESPGDRRTETRSLQGGMMIVETVWTLGDGVPPIVKRLVYSKAGG
jgi:hypothetical protein